MKSFTPQQLHWAMMVHQAEAAGLTGIARAFLIILHEDYQHGL